MIKSPRQRNRKMTVHAPVITVLFIILIVFMVFYVWIYNRTNALYQEVADLKRLENEMSAQNKILAVEIEQLSRSDRIKEIASTQLQMVVPVPETLAVVIDASWAN